MSEETETDGLLSKMKNLLGKKNVDEKQDEEKECRKSPTEDEEAPEDPPQPDDNENSSGNELKVYDMSTMPCGRCLIFNNEFPKDVTIIHRGKEEILEPRLNSDKDVQRISEIFSWLRFQVSIHRNTTRDEMMKLLKKEAKDKTHKTMSCLVVFILSYGREDIEEDTGYVYGGIYSKDGNFCSMNEIIELFKAHKTKNPLKNKPKLFFIQASPPKKKMEVNKDDDSAKESRLKPVDEDIFVRSSPYVKDWQWPDGGSMFIQILCNILQSKAGQYSLDDLMTVLNNQLSKRVTHMNGVFQWNTLSGQLKFNPSTSRFKEYKNQNQKPTQASS